MKIEIRNSQPFILLVYLASIFIIGIAYIILNEQVRFFYNRSFNDTFTTQGDYQQFYMRAKTIWTWLPLMLMLPFVLWMFVKSVKREDRGY